VASAVTRASAALIVLILPACGPLMDFRDSLSPGMLGPYTPNGQIKRDFWGNTYLEPYRRPPLEPGAPPPPADEANKEASVAPSPTPVPPSLAGQ
jgi:hypothetical protein